MLTGSDEHGATKRSPPRAMINHRLLTRHIYRAVITRPVRRVARYSHRRVSSGAK
jgi:hypothetical protein